jgi:hypothetical protein
MKKLPVFLALLWSTIAFSQISISLHPNKEEGAFMPDIFGNAQNNRDLAISSDGNEIYSTVVSPRNIFSAIICVKKNAGGWGKPEVASFSGKYSDLEPFFAPGSNRLYFASNRPLSQEGEPKKDFDIWYTELENGKWSEPKNMGAPVNTDKDEFYPSLGNSGNIYFTASYADSKGKEDIYLCKYENGKYAPPVSLDTSINSKLYEFNAYISPDERTIIFTSFGRADDKGRGDLYMSTKNDKGEWAMAKNLATVNSPFLDYCPFVDWKNKIFYFTSEKTGIKDHYPERLNYKQLIAILNGSENGTGSIYSVKLDKILPVK